ncbi:MAG: cobalamin-dependent protein [Chloroflexota bacterium]
MADLAALTAAVERGDRKEATRLTAEAIDAGIAPGPILDAMTTAMSEVGRRFACGQGVYVPEMLVAARAMKESTALLQPLLVAEGITPEHTVVMGTVKGDLHDIGKNLVGMMLRGANLAVVDLGTNVEPARFAEAAREHGAELVAVSALLTTTMVGMKDVVDAVRATGLGLPVIVGGAPVTQEYCEEIGADGYAADAATAVEVARALIARSPGVPATA